MSTSQVMKVKQLPLLVVSLLLFAAFASGLMTRSSASNGQYAEAEGNGNYQELLKISNQTINTLTDEYNKLAEAHNKNAAMLNGLIDTFYSKYPGEFAEEPPIYNSIQCKQIAVKNGDKTEPFTSIDMPDAGLVLESKICKNF